MSTGTGLAENRLRSLQREWLLYAGFSAVFLGALFWLLRRTLGAGLPERWLLAAGALTLYQVLFLWRHLSENHLKENEALLFSNLGLANWLTIIRAVFTAALSGFLLGPWPQGWLAWLPSILYLVSSIMDYLDGFAARVTGRTTVLGERLDMMWDSAALLFAAALAVRYGQAPVPFLLVGLARYFYLAGLWWLGRQRRQVYDLLPSRIRRPFAGMMMGFVAVILMPVYAPPATLVASVLFMIPFLIEFSWDWLTVSGQIHRAQQAQLSPRSRWLRIIVPLAARVILVIALIELIVHALRMDDLPLSMLVVAGIGALALLLGAAGRVFALVVLLMAGFGLRSFPTELRFWFILLISTLSMMVGTGRYSLWKPEDWLLYTRAGERRGLKAPQG